MPEGSVTAIRTIDFATASPQIRNALGIDLNDLFLSVRTKNVLKLAGIRYVGDLVPFEKASVGAFQNCGAKTLAELQDILDAFGLQFGTDVIGWTPPETPSSAELPNRATPVPQVKNLADYDPQIRALFRVRLSQLGFSRRASNIFAVQGLEFVGDLVRKSAQDLLRTSGSGRITIAEIAEKLGKLGLKLETVIADWNPSVANEQDQDEERERHAALAQVRSIFAATPQADCLEDELLGILATVAKDRDFEAIPKLFGWTGFGQRTLESVGQEFGVTRERIRQIAARATRKLRPLGFDTPWVDKALDAAKDACPAAPKDIGEYLHGHGIARTDFDPSGLETACEAFGKKFELSRTWIGREVVYEEKRYEGKARMLLRACKRLTGSNGCTNYDSACVEADIPEEKRAAYRRILEIDGLVVWLDENREWLMTAAPARNRLSNLVAKVLHVAPRIALSELRRAVSKSKRLTSAPPLSVLATFVEKSGLARIEGSRAVALSDFSVAIEPGGAEDTLIGVLKANGPAISVEKLQELCIAAGMNPVTVGIYISISPVVARLARGVYGLVGADVPPGLVEEVGKELTASRKAAEWGWSAKGTLWCAIHLTRLSLTSGAISIPKFVSEFAEGEWQPEIAGRSVDATVKCRDNFLWGLKRPLVNVGAEPGDVCVLEFERSTRKVRLTVGDEELIDLWERGDIDAANSVTFEPEQHTDLEDSESEDMSKVATR